MVAITNLTLALAATLFATEGLAGVAAVADAAHAEDLTIPNGGFGPKHWHVNVKRYSTPDCTGEVLGKDDLKHGKCKTWGGGGTYMVRLFYFSPFPTTI